MKRWPTTPVAPRIPARNFVVILSTRFRLETGYRPPFRRRASAGSSPPLNKSGYQRLQCLTQTSHTFAQFRFVGTKRDTQETLTLVSKRGGRNCYYPLFQPCFGNAQFIAVPAHVNHRVEGAVRRHAAQAKIIAK